MAKNLASLTLMLGANITDFQTKMRKASKTLERTGKNLQRMGKNMSMYVTAPLSALGAASVAAFDKQAQAEAKLAAQIRANGKDVQATMADYKAYASHLQELTIVGDETSLALMQMAESMQATNAKEATANAIGLSKALGVDLKSALKMVVLAQKGEYTMLNRYVPSLRSATSETEKAAIVQKLYSDGMNIAQAEAKNGLGPLKQLQNSIGDLMESFGKIITEAINPFIGKLKKIVEHFQNLSPKGKKTIAVIAGIAAAIGPALIALGTLASILPTIAAGFAMITGPVGIAIAAIAAIGAAFVYIYGNWQAFKERLTDWNWLRNAAIDAFIALIKASSYFMNEIAKLFGLDFVSPMVEQLEKLKVPITEEKTEFKSFGDTVKQVAGEAMSSLGFFTAKAETTAKSVSTSFGKMHKSVNELILPMKKLDISVKKIEGTLNDMGDIRMPDVQYSSENISESTAEYEETVINSWKNAFEGIRMRLAQFISEIGISLGEAIGNMMSGVNPDFGQDIIERMGAFIKDLGKMMIQYGSLMLAFSILSKNPNPISAGLAIVAGIAAVAIGQAIMNKAKAGAQGMANGGVVPPGFPGDTYPALLTSGEMVIPAPQRLPAFGGGAAEIDVRGNFTLQGKDLIVSFAKSQRVNQRITG